MFQITSLRKASAFTSNNWQSAICFFFSTVWQVQITLSYHCGNVILLSTLSYILSYHRRNIKNYGCVCSSKSKTFLYFCCPLLSSQIVLMIPFSQKLLLEYFFRSKKQNQNLSSWRNNMNVYNNGKILDKVTLWLHLFRYLTYWFPEAATGGVL